MNDILSTKEKWLTTILTGVWRWPWSCGRIERLGRQSSTLRPEIWTAVGDGSVTEVVAVASGSQNRNGASVDAIRTALSASRSSHTEPLPSWDVRSRVRVRTVAGDRLD